MSDIEIKGKNGGPPKAKFDLDPIEWVILISGAIIAYYGYLILG